MIDKNSSRYKYLKRKEKKDSVSLVDEQSLEDRSENLRRLYRYSMLWHNNSSYRMRRERVKNYERGKQWEDIIEVHGKKMTEAAHIIEQGSVPLKNNIILQTQNSVVGVFRSNYSLPEAVARTRDNQNVGQTMTAMLRYVSQINEQKENDVKDFMEGLRGGLAVQYVNHEWNDETQTDEVVVKSINPTRLILNGGIEDPNGGDITTIGVLMDSPIEKVVQDFAKSDDDAERIRQIYKNVTKYNIERSYNSLTGHSGLDIDFFICKQEDRCRVIQVWEKESEECWRVRDRYEETVTIYPKSDKKAIDEMIREREEDIRLNDLDPDKTRITCERFEDRYWYVRYMSPFGDVLYEGKSPFAHRSHPFVVYFSRLVDGEIYSFEEGIIDQQRYINRLITLNDFIMASSAKGVLVFPENAIPKGMNKEDILEQWVSHRGVIFANLKPGMALPQQISQNSTHIGTNELLALQLQMVRDISGVHGAMLGKEAKSGTAASLYAQEASNAQTNLLDTIESFNAFRKRRDYKVAKTIPQCYDYIDYIPIVGREYSDEQREWNAELASKFDYYILISESNNKELYQAQLNDLLMAALQQRLIDFETALEAGRFPFSDEVLRIIDRKKQEAQQEQAQMQAMQLQGAAMGEQMRESGASQGDILQASADIGMQAIQNAAQQADPRAMQMIQQAVG